jgi:hypothetical protein
VVRSLLIYRRDSERVFSRHPDARWEETFTAKQIKGIGQRITFEADILGRGRRCALLVDRNGALIARAVSTSLALETEPFWSFVPRRTILSVDTRDLNGDKRSDVILRHIRSLTVLVSR